MSAAPDPLVGTNVDRYTVVRRLGSGGMGVVYEAEDTRLGRRVALKFLPPELMRDPPALERFQREARAASALNHPGICTVYAFEEHERRPFIVMELLEGRTLAHLMTERSPLELESLISIGIQIADALESAHGRGIVHRDVKPGNVFVNDRGQVKVLDFGLARIEGTRQKSDGTVSRLDTLPARQELTTAGTAMGTVSYMSPEQARGQVADARTDLFSLGTVLYQMATGALPFPGDTDAVVFDAILNRDPRPPAELNPNLPPELGRILEKAFEKDRTLRYQTATDLKTDLARLKRDIESGRRRVADRSDSRGGRSRQAEKSIAVLYFENLAGSKEDEYLRDGITEDVITELSKIRGLNIFSRPTVLAYRDKPVTPGEIGQQLGAACVLAGSLRRAGSRLRINVQLVDTQTDFPVWSERYDREMKDVFEVQDEIARKIAEALRVTLTPQEEAALAAKETENLEAYDRYLRGKNYARRLTRQDFEFALQLFESAVALDPDFALAHAAIANVSAQSFYNYGRDPAWMDRARGASRTAVALRPQLPEVLVAQAWILYAEGQNDDASRCVREAIGRKGDCEGAYYLLGRALFASGRHQELANLADTALAASPEDYYVHVPIENALGALGKDDALRNIRLQRVTVIENHLRHVPEDARARIELGCEYAFLGRTEDALREISLAVALRPNEATVLYSAACAFSLMKKKAEALEALRKAWDAGFRDAVWARQDPELAFLYGDAEFERLYPERPSGT